MGNLTADLGRRVDIFAFSQRTKLSRENQNAEKLKICQNG